MRNAGSNHILTYQGNVDKTNYSIDTCHHWTKVTQLLSWHQPQSVPKVLMISYQASLVLHSLVDKLLWITQHVIKKTYK